MRRHHPGTRALVTVAARAAAALAAGIGSALVVVSAAPLVAGASGIIPPSNPAASVPPQVIPACSLSPVDDKSSGCTDSILHDINYARWLEGLGPLVLPGNYASDAVAVQQLVLTDEERDDRGLSPYSGLDATLNTAALAGATTNSDPLLPSGFVGPGGSIFAQDYTPLGADFAWMYDDGYGGTNLLCTSPGASGCWGHRDNILGPWASGSGQTAMMGDANTLTGQYAEIFAYQPNPADSLVDPITPSSLPTPSTPAAPDVVQVVPASSPDTGAGTPVTIEGNYFTASPVPQVFFGGVPATNVHVNWDGELTADAPADPAGNVADQVVVTVTAGAFSSSTTGTPAVNEFDYAPANAPTTTSVSPTSGAQVPPTGSTVVIKGTNFFDGGVTPIVDFGNVASFAHELQRDPDHRDHPTLHQPGHGRRHRHDTRGNERRVGGRPVHLHGERDVRGPHDHERERGHVLGGNGRSVRRHDHGNPRRQLLDGLGVQRLHTVDAACQHHAQLHRWIDRLPGRNARRGDGGTYTVCLVASNGVGVAGQAAVHSHRRRTTTPASAAASTSAASTSTRTDPRLLAGGIGRRHLQLRFGRVPRLHRLAPPPTAGRRHHPDGGPGRLLARRLRRRASSPSATRASTAPSPAAGYTPPARACRAA